MVQDKLTSNKYSDLNNWCKKCNFTVLSVKVDEEVMKPPLTTVRAHSASMLSICLFVSLPVAKMQKNAIFSKTKQFRAMVSIDDL